MMPPSILRALWMALGSFLHPIILWHMLWPVLVGICLWFVVFFGGWWLIEPLMTPYLHEGASVLPQWLLNLGVAGAAAIVLQIALGFLLLPLISLTFVILLSIFSLPLILPIIARQHYPELEAQHAVSVTSGIWHTLKTSTFFVVLYIASYALLFIPPIVPIAHWLLVAQLNKRTFVFDALADYASKAEYEHVQEAHGTPLLVLGGLVSSLTYIPFANLLAPALAGLCFVHYSLAALQFHRFHKQAIPPDHDFQEPPTPLAINVDKR